MFFVKQIYKNYFHLSLHFHTLMFLLGEDETLTNQNTRYTTSIS